MPELPRTALCAHVSALPGLCTPANVLELLRRRELGVVEAPALALPQSQADAFALIWVDTHWAEGVSFVQALAPLELRARCVLIGRQPPLDIGPQLRAAGALTYLREDFPAWLLPPLRAALARLAKLADAPSYALLRALRGPKLAHESAILDAILRLATELFHADQVRVLVRKRPDEKVCVLQECANSVQLVPWDQAQDIDLTSLFEAAASFGDQVALPCLDQAPLAAPLSALHALYRGAAAISCHMGSDLQAVIVLLWREPFLLNPVEVASLDALALLGGAAWSHLTLSLAAPRAAEVVRAVENATATKRVQELQRELLRSVAELAGVQGALLVLCDAEEAPARLHYACEWFEAGREQVVSSHRDLYCAVPDQRTADAYRNALVSDLARRSSPLRVLDCLLLPESSSAAPGALLLLADDECGQPGSQLRFHLRLCAAKERLRLGWASVEAQQRLLKESAVNRFSALGGNDTTTGMGVLGALKRTAALVAEVVAAEQVFVQYGVHVVSFPERPDAALICTHEGSLTRYAKKHGAPARVLSTEDGERDSYHRLDHAGLVQLSQALGVDHIRSVIVCPIGDGLGMLKIVSSSAGAFLTADDAQLAAALARRLGEIAVSALRSEVLHSLNHLASTLAGLAGQELSDGLVRELERWCARFIRPHSLVFVQAKDGTQSLLLQAVSPKLSGEVRAQLERGAVSTQLEHDHVLRAPLALAHAGLQGELVIVHRQRFPSYAPDYLLDAAREVSLLLNAEYVRHELRKQSGVFRHGLLGPIQGLASNAKLLQRESQQPGQALPPQMQRCVREILCETQRINQWRDRHRLFASFQEHHRLDVRRTCHELRPFVEQCSMRYEAAMAERNLSFSLQLPRGGVQFRFDAYALDIALSNLLDNAVKYAFFNREIAVGMQMQRHSVDIWVEDVGHDIPADQTEQIYLPGGRGAQHDPLRVIHGEGLGLYIARAIARAHDGELSHSVRREGRELGDKTPYRVRFTMNIAGG